MHKELPVSGAWWVNAGEGRHPSSCNNYKWWYGKSFPFLWLHSIFPFEREKLEDCKVEINDLLCFQFTGWVEGIRLSDGERGWFPKTYVEEITSRSARLRNLRENIRIKCVSQKLEGETLWDLEVWDIVLPKACCIIWFTKPEYISVNIPDFHG